MDHEKELVEALTDADWAGDKSTPASHISSDLCGQQVGDFMVPHPKEHSSQELWE